MKTRIDEILKGVDAKYLKSKLPSFNVGDTVKMKIKVQEADKARLHPFEGIVISKTRRGLRSTFTVRKVAFGEGVERIFPIHSPVIEELKVVNKAASSRAKLYYLRYQVGKARIKQAQAREKQAAVAAN